MLKPKKLTLKEIDFLLDDRNFKNRKMKNTPMSRKLKKILKSLEKTLDKLVEKGILEP